MSSGVRPEDHPLLLSNLPPTPFQKRLAAGIAVALFLGMLLAAPFSRLPLHNTEAFLPAYAGAMMMTEVITAALLLALFSVQRSWGVFALSAGYLLSGLLVLPWALTFPGIFPGIFPQSGLPEAGTQTTAAIAAIRRIGFPVFVLVYALLKHRQPRDMSNRASRGIVLRGVAAILGAVALISWLILSNPQAMPTFMKDARHISFAWNYVPATALLLYAAVMTALWRRLDSVLDLWLISVIWALTIEVVLLSFISGGIRLSLGWWAGRLYGFASASVVLLALLAETTSLSTRVARAALAERRAREARFLAMQALSAAIAHEVSQPVASMVVNAESGVRWLSRANPNLEEARDALQNISRDGRGIGEVIQSIRSIFTRGSSEHIPLDLNRLIGEVLARYENEARLGRAIPQTNLDATLPLVTGNPVQLRHVLTNLLDNAVEAMQAVGDRSPVLRIRSRLRNPGEIQVEVEDCGPGLSAAHRERVFEAFFSTKADGMGIGLLFCRSVIEAHGGRLWATDGASRGTVFHFTLPRADLGRPAAQG